MRLLYFAFVELDVPNACQTHTLGVVRGFAKNSCKIDAVVPRPKRVRPKIENVRFMYIWPWGFSRIGKLFLKVSTGLLLFLLCTLKKYDAMYVREMECNPIPRIISIIFKLPLFIEVNGILIEDLKLENVPKNRLNRAERNQRKDFNHSPGLIIPSYPRLLWIQDYYKVEHSKTHLVLNGTELPSQEKDSRESTLERLSLPTDGFYLGYLGTLWYKYDTASILKAIKRLEKQICGIYMLVIGGGPGEDLLKSQAAELNVLHRIKFFGFIQPELLPQVIGAIDLGVVNLTKIGIRDLGPVTTRFTTFAINQVPILSSGKYLKYYPSEISENVFSTPEEEVVQITDTISWIYHNELVVKEKSRRLREYVLNSMNWDTVSADIAGIIKRTIVGYKGSIKNYYL